MRKNNQCKICRSGYAEAILYHSHILKTPYLKIIEEYEDCIPCLNLYNLSTHFNRHVEMQDIRKAEATFAEVKRIVEAKKQKEND